MYFLKKALFTTNVSYDCKFAMTLAKGSNVTRTFTGVSKLAYKNARLHFQNTLAYCRKIHM